MITLKDARLISKSFISFAPNIHLKLGRAHEICGPAKIRTAILIGAKSTGLIVWIRPNWKEFIINTDSISDWFSPSQLLIIKAKNKTDLLYAA